MLDIFDKKHRVVPEINITVINYNVRGEVVTKITLFSDLNNHRIG